MVSLFKRVIGFLILSFGALVLLSLSGCAEEEEKKETIGYVCRFDIVQAYIDIDFDYSMDDDTIFLSFSSNSTLDETVTDHVIEELKLHDLQSRYEASNKSYDEFLRDITNDAIKYVQILGGKLVCKAK